MTNKRWRDFEAMLPAAKRQRGALEGTTSVLGSAPLDLVDQPEKVRRSQGVFQ